MGTHDVYDSPVDKERIVDYVGGGAGHQAIHVRSITGPGRSGAHDEDVLGDFHSSTDLAGLADLCSPVYDLERLPAHFDLTADDASIIEAQSAPWDPGRLSNPSHRSMHRHAPLNSTVFASDHTQRGAHLHPSSGYSADGRLEAQHAHSSTNGISDWDDFSIGHEPPEESCSGFSVHHSLQSPSVWSLSEKLLHYLSPTTQSSQDAPQTGETHSLGTTAKSTTKSAQSEQHTAPRPQKPSRSYASEETGPSSVEVSVGPPNNAGGTGLHVCVSCDKSFSSRSGLRHHKEIHDPAKMNAHSCPMCQHRCRYQKDLKRHLKTHKEDKEEHHCPVAGCLSTVTRKDNLKRHLKTHSMSS